MKYNYGMKQKEKWLFGVSFTASYDENFQIGLVVEVVARSDSTVWSKVTPVCSQMDATDADCKCDRFLPACL